MTPSALLADILARGVQVWAEDDSLCLAGAKGVLESHTREALKRVKPELIELLGDRRKHAAISFAQKRLWFFEQLVPGTNTYTMHGAFRFTGPLDIDVLRRSVDQVVLRHEALRTTFRPLEGQPVQVIALDGKADVRFHDFSAEPREEASRRIDDLLLDAGRTVFDIASGPLVRVVVARESTDEHVFILIIHHIVSDGWSLRIFMRDMTTVYGALIKNAPSPLPQLPLQYAEFTRLQRGWLDNRLHDHLDYWKTQLAALPPIELPMDRPRPESPTFRGDREQLELAEEVSDAIRELARTESATLYMILLAAYELMLHRYSGQTDFAIGSPSAGRSHPGTEQIIGLFVNTLVLRADLSGDPSFRELLRRVRRTVLDAFEHQDLPFERIVEEIQPERHLSRNPLVQVVFNLLSVGPQRKDIPGLSFRVLSRTEQESKVDLMLYTKAKDGALRFGLVYNTALLDQQTVEGMLRHFGVLISAAVANPDAPISTLPLLDASERQAVLSSCLGPATPRTDAANAAQIIEWQANRGPDAIATEYKGSTLTYAQMNARANQLARRLRSLGVQPESIVGIALDRSHELVVAMLAVLKAGGAYLPLDPEYPADRLTYMLSDAAAKLVLSTSSVSLALPDGVARFDLDTSIDATARESDTNLDHLAGPDNIAYVIYTSGSTGRPKGTLIEHGGLCNLMAFAARTSLYNCNARVLQFASLSFDASVWEILLSLSTGATLILADRETLMAPDSLARLLRDARITTATLPPTMLALLEPGDLSGLTTIVSAGERCPAPIAKRWAQGRRFINGYGPTETTVCATAFEISGAIDSAIPIGRPIDNTQIYVLDAAMQPVPPGLAGEVYIGGLGVARGYINQPELTAERFIPNPFADEPGARLYRTGDRAKIRRDGFIEYLGRLDNQVKLRGFRIELGEIERVLMEHPTVKNAVAIVREDSTGEAQLVAYVESAASSTNEWARFLAAKLPNHMAPSAIVALDRFPLTPNGKIDVRALPAPASIADSASTAEHVDARGPIEDLLADIWCEVLTLDSIGVTDNFFEIGGHSLKATRVISRIRDVFNVELPLRSIFQSPTVAGLAAQVSAALTARTEPAPPIVSRERSGPLPLSFAQQRLWFIERLGARGAYTIAFTLRMQGPLNIRALNESLTEIRRRHEVLRTRFVAVDGIPFQVIDPPSPVAMTPEPIDNVDGTDAIETAASRARAFSRQPFDLERGPLFRAHVYKLAGDDHVLSVAMHHIVSDGWSQGVFMRELAALYGAYANNAASPLPDLSVQYADFALWQRDWLHGNTLESMLQYWLSQLEGAPDFLPLPTDRPRPKVQTFSGARESIALGEELTESLRDFGKREGATLFMSMLAAFNVLLAKYSGHKDIVVGTPIANRNRAETEPLIGFFVNSLALRTRLDDDPTAAELVQRVRETSLAAFAHQDLPFEKLVERLHPDRDMGHSPIFQVVFAFQNVRQPKQKFADLEVTRIANPGGRARFDLTLYVSETAKGMNVSAEYNTDLFDADSIRRMLAHYTLVLDRFAAAPQSRVSAISLLTEACRNRILDEWNTVARDYPRDASVSDLFERQVEASHRAIAATWGNESLSYTDLNAQANRIARALVAGGVKPTDAVVIAMERGLPVVVAQVAVLKAGGVYVPIDLDFPDSRIEFMVKDTGAAAALTVSRHFERLAKLGLHACIAVDSQTGLPHDSTNLNLPVSATSPAYIMYTSGSTGTPKGVVVPHRAIVRLVMNTDYVSIGADDRIAHAATPSFDAATFEIWGALLNGACVVGIDKETAIDPVAMSAKLESERVTALFLTTALFNQIAQHRPDALRHLRYLLFGGEQCDPEAVRNVLNAGRPLHLLHVYGPTENTTFSTWHEVGDIPEGAATIPIGKPIANSSLYILDESLQPVPVGIPGEIYVGGDGLALGYLNAPDLNELRFIANPFDPNQRLYRTGDIARYRDDGAVEFIGRVDNQVKIRGFRIEPGEIERVLRSIDGINDAYVSDFIDQQGSRALAAYVVVNGAPTGMEQLHTTLKSKLPAYMIPTRIVPLERLPLNANGKIDKRALPDPHAAALTVTRISEAPETPVQRTIASIWSALLGRDNLGIHDNFLDIGGHSMLCVQMLAKLNDAFEVELSLRDVFEEPTISGLATRIESIMQGAKLAPPAPLPAAANPECDVADLVVPIRQRGSKTPIFLVAPAGGTIFAYYALAHHLGADQPVYGLQDPAFMGTRPPCKTIEEMAAMYIRAIRSVQPAGPHIIAGWSLGGTIAYEMAKQLDAQGDRPSHVFLIETITGLRKRSNGHSNGSGNGKGKPKWTIKRRAAHMRDSIVFNSKFAWSGLVTGWEGFVATMSVTAVGKGFARATRGIRRKLRARGEGKWADTYVRKRRQLEGTEEDSGTILMRQSFARHWIGIAYANTKAFRRYMPDTYDGKLTLFYAESRRGSRKPADETRGWSAFTTGEVEVIGIPGDHFSILRDPNVRVFVQKLNACISPNGRPETSSLENIDRSEPAATKNPRND